MIGIGRQHGRRFVLLSPTHRPQRRPCPCLQAGAETFGTSAELLSWTQAVLWEGHSAGVGAGVGNENKESCRFVRPLRIP